MTRTLFGVVCDAKTLAIKRIIVPDDDSELLGHAGIGEVIFTSPLRLGGHTINDAINLVRLKTGREPPAMRNVLASDQVARGLKTG